MVIISGIIKALSKICYFELSSAAIKMGFNDTRCVMEPAGALAMAGMIKYTKQHQWKGKTCVAITSGT